MSREMSAKFVKQLWTGKFPLGRVFWHYAVAYGLLINLVTDLAFYALLLNDANMVLVVLAFASPVPYNIFIIVAVWRSADHYRGPKRWAELAQVGTVIWMLALTVI